jgi:uncharacterized cofD-like protein
MMEQFSGDFLAAVGGLRALLGCVGSVWPVSVEPSSICALYSDGSRTRGEVEVDAGQSEGLRVEQIWLEPAATIHPETAAALRGFDAITIGPGSFFTSLMPIFQVHGVTDAIRSVRGPVILIANLLTEGRGMRGFTAADAVRRIGGALGRPVDVLVHNTALPGADVIDRYREEHKEPLLLGDVPAGCAVVSGEFWQRDIARHDRRRLAYAVWTALAQRLLG